MITVTTEILAPIGKVWEYFNTPQHIKQWYTASSDWHTPHAENDLHIGEKFNYRMEAKDGSFGFNFSGVYNEVMLNKKIASTLDDGRKLIVEFKENENSVTVTEHFEPENENSEELQQTGWQAILTNFKLYTENN